MEKVIFISMSNLFIIGYFTSMSGLLRSMNDLLCLFAGLLFMDCMWLFLWQPLMKNNKY